MTPEERQALAQYRRDQAEHTLKQAEVLAGVAEWAGVVNRAYYAMFYAALALLATRDQGTPRKHTGVLASLDREFVRDGSLSKDHAVRLRSAFHLRQRTDYVEVAPADAEEAQRVLDDARAFLAAVFAHIPPASGREPTQDA